MIIATNLLMMSGLFAKCERLPESAFDRGAYCSGQRVTPGVRLGPKAG